MRYPNRTGTASRWALASVGALLLFPLLTSCRVPGGGPDTTATSWKPHPGRVASLNITNPSDPPPDAIAQYIAKVGPEVIAFQEACVKRTKQIAAALDRRGMHYTVVHGSVARVATRCGVGDDNVLGASGNALLLANGVTGRSGNVKYQVNDTDNDETRGYVYAQTTVNGSPVTVYGTQLAQHLPSLADTRTSQVDELAKAAGLYRPEQNSIIMGDFNTEPGEAVLGKIRAGWVDADPNCTATPNARCTPTQVGAAKKLDYIWLKPGFYGTKPPGVTTVRTRINATARRHTGKEQGPPATEYTDHDLVYADLKPAATPTPTAGGPVKEQTCYPGQSEPCVHTDLLTGSTEGQPGQGHGLSVAPERMFVGSNLSLSKLRWSTWGGRTARAKGRMTATTCVPNCAEGTVRDYGPVEVEVFHLASTANDIQVYTCGRVRKPGKDWGSVDPSLERMCVNP